MMMMLMIMMIVAYTLQLTHSLSSSLVFCFRVDDFWPWVKNKAENGTTFFGKQHFRSGGHIAAPRDGVPRDSDDAATDTITDAEASAISSTIETRRFGMQESYDYYQLCKSTARNRGLYTADQILKRNDQRATRTNPNGDRRGFECPEERDYYPWWHPSPWIGKTDDCSGNNDDIYGDSGGDVDDNDDDGVDDDYDDNCYMLMQLL